MILPSNLDELPTSVLDELPSDWLVIIDVWHLEYQLNLTTFWWNLDDIDDIEFINQLSKLEISSSNTQNTALEEGITLLSKLLKRWTPWILNICLGDTSKNVLPEIRQRLHKLFVNWLDTNNFKLLPTAYQDLINKYNIPFTLINITFQSSNSNKATALIKKIKKKILWVWQEQAFNETWVIWLWINETDLFAISTPELIFWSSSIIASNDDNYNDKFIWLYWGKWILCPATCAWMLQTCLNSFNWKKIYYLSIYDENDDPSIWNKLHSWVYSIRWLNKTWLSVNVTNIIKTKDWSLRIRNFAPSNSLNEVNATYKEFSTHLLKLLESFEIVPYESVKAWDKQISPWISVCLSKDSCNIN